MCEEARHVWELYESDRVREFYLRADHRPRIVLIFECGDPTEAERLVAELPIVGVGLLEFEVVPLRPYAGLRQLFGNPS